MRGHRGHDRRVVGFTITGICNQCLSPLMLWVRISIRARCTTLCDKVCQWLATGQWFSPGSPVSSTNKTDRHNITEIVLKVALNTIKQTKTNKHVYIHVIITYMYYLSLILNYNRLSIVLIVYGSEAEVLKCTL